MTLSESKKWVRAKRLADQIPADYPQRVQKACAAIQAMNLSSVICPWWLNSSLSIEEWQGQLRSRLLGYWLYGSTAFGETLSVHLPGERMRPALPRELLDVFPEEWKTRVDRASCEEGWLKLCHQKLGQARHAFKEVCATHEKPMENRLDFYCLDAPREAGPIHGELREDTLANWLVQRLWAEGVKPVNFAGKDFEAGHSEEADWHCEANQIWPAPLQEGFRKPLFRLEGSRLLKEARCQLEKGSGWKAWILPEVLQALQAVLIPSKAFPRRIYSTNSMVLSRPLWTWVARSKGAETTMIWYSTNTRSVEVEGVDEGSVRTFVWSLDNWKKYYVWDSCDAQWISDQNGGEAVICGSIPFVDSGEPIPDIPPKSVAVFDVQPHRDGKLSRLGMGGIYYQSDSTVQFLQDVVEACRGACATAVFKRKRDIGRGVHPRYLKTWTGLATESHVIQVKPGVAASRVIRQCHAVISAPFTSTALQAAQAGIPSCYYDPSGTLRREQSGAHGIELIQSPPALRIWLNRVLV